MKNRTLFSIAGMTAFCFALMSAAPVYAKSPQRYRWEGVAIGLGAAILGSAVLHHGYHYRPAPPPYYRHPPWPEHPRRPECYRWETRREWVPPQYDWVWIPGHHGRRGHYAPGHWERRLISPGYWETKRYCLREP